jgi:glutathione S-transferase
MKLYYSPGACSLACRISLHEAGLAFVDERVDLKTKTTEHGHDFRAINPKGYVPMLVLDDGAAITENVAVLDYIAGIEPKLGVQRPLGRTRLIEMLSYLSTELHAAFKQLWHDASEADKSRAREAVAARLAFLEGQLQGDHLFGASFTVADAYLFVMLRWARGFGVPVPVGLDAFFNRILARETVRQSLAEERLTKGGAGPILTMVPN